MPDTGNASLPIGEGEGDGRDANQEIGDPKRANQEIGEPKRANREIRDTKQANREIGGPGGGPGHRGWHSRGYLPHFDSDVDTQHVTFHLADSLPKEVLQRLEEELKAVPEAKRDVERRKRVEAWIDAGHGSCVLRDPDIAQMVEGSFLFFDGQRYQLLAWVVMPNHVHVLFQPVNGWSVAKIVASWKKFTATRICAYRKNAGNATLLIGEGRGGARDANREIGDPKQEKQEIGHTKRANREIGGPGGGPIWQREYWDRYMRDECHFQQAIQYIYQNPVKAGLVAKAEDWPWGSARFNKEGHWRTRTANQEIGDPTQEKQEIGDTKQANREIGGPARISILH